MNYTCKNIIPSKGIPIRRLQVRNIFFPILSVLFFLFSPLTSLNSKAQIVINEVGIAPSSGNTGGGSEFIELFNKGGCSVNIGCYVILFVAKDPTFGLNIGWTVTIPSGTSLGPGAYYLIGGGGSSSISTNWQNGTNAGNNWNYAGSNGRNPDLSLKGSNSTVLTTTVGLLTDAAGQISLYNPSGIIVTSVSWNSGNNNGSYNNSFSNAPIGCAAINPIANPGASSNNKIGTFNSFTQGLYLDASGAYQTETSLTPGNANNLNGGSQITNSPAPTISKQPISQADCDGNQVIFSGTINSSSPNYNYTWYYKRPTDASFSVLTGPTSSSSTTTTLTVTGIGSTSAPTNTQYYFIATDANGCSVTSNTVTLTVNELTGISPSNTSTTICEGGSYILTASTTGIVASYQWLLNGTAIPGSTSSTLNVTNATSANSGSYQIRVVFNGIDNTGAANTCTRTSGLVRNLLVISSNGGTIADQTICTGAVPNNLTLTGYTGTVTKWEWSTSNTFPNGNSTNSLVTSSPTLLGSQIGSVTTTLYVRAYVKNGSCTEVTSAVATISLYPVTGAPTVVGGATCGPGTVTLQASGCTGTIRWYADATTTTVLATGSIYSPSINTSTIYFVSCTNANGCESARTAVGADVLSISPGTIQTGTTSYCGTAPAITLSNLTDGGLSGNGNGGNSYTLSYTWQSSTDNSTWIDIANSNSNTYTVPSGLTSTTYFRRVIIFTHSGNGNSCKGNSNVITITVNPKAILSSTLIPPAVCSNTAFNYTATSNTSGATFSWTRAAVAGISNPSSSGNGNINETLINTTSAPVTVTYVYSITASGCVNNQNVIVTINPKPAPVIYHN